MILTLALRELRKSWGALLQAGSLAVAVATLAASFQLSSQVSAKPVAGSSCGEDVLALSWANDRGDLQDAFSPRQAQALSNAMAGTLSAQMLVESGEVSAQGQKQQVGLAYVEPQYFRTLCVKRFDALGQIVQEPFQQGLVVEQSAAKAWDRPVISISGMEATATSATREFTGLDTVNPVLAFAPYSLVQARGQGYMNFDAPMVKVVLRLRQGETLAALRGKLEAARKNQSSLFSSVARIEVGPPLQVGSQTAMKIGRMSILLRVFAGALLALVVVNLLTYHMGRISSAQTLATTLAALGVPPKAIAAYAAIEPVAVGLAAWVAGTALSLPLANAAMEVASLDGEVGQSYLGMLATFLMVAVISAIITVVRTRVLRRRAAPNKGKGKRLLLKMLPLLLGVQVALAGATLVVAAQASIGLVRALPPPPNIPLDGLSAVQIDLSTAAVKQQNVSMRWDAAWKAHGRVGYDAALATDLAPFLPNSGFMGTLYSGNRSTQAGFSYTTPNFFRVLGTKEVDASVFMTDLDQRNPENRGRANHIVLNPLVAKILFPAGGEDGAVLRYTYRVGQVDPSQLRSTVVIGTFHDGVVGARGAVGKIEVTQLSMQAAVPMVYQPLLSVDETTSLTVFVRHPAGATKAQLATTVLPAVREVFPGAKVASVQSAQDLFESPLRRERALALILGLLSIASVGIGTLGMLSLMAMLLAALKVELAVRVAVGADRTAAARVLLKKLLVPVAVGLMGAIVPAGLGLVMLGRMLETAQRAGAIGPILTVACLGAAVAGACLALLRAIRGANMMDWLRYE